MLPEVDGQEIVPVLLCRVEAGNMECALWKPQGGTSAVALFLNAESAAAYQTANGLDASWQQYQPSRVDLLEILRQMHTAGVTVAVLDPDQSTAKRLFNLHAVLENAGMSNE